MLKRTIYSAMIAFLTATSAVSADVRIKDIAYFEGIRENQLIGYGLVVGLNGTGDNLSNSPHTKTSIEGMLEKLGVGNKYDDSLKSKNAAAVMVTASLPPFARQGNELDITVSSLFDSTSLQGGTLIITPLSGADGEIYAVAQGPIAVAGFNAQGDAASVTEGVPTVARIENGATVEREIEFDLNSMENIRVSLREPDLTTSARVEQAINKKFGKIAEMLDPSTVQVARPNNTSIPKLLAAIEQVEVQPDTVAKVVVDAKSGTIVMGDRVRISSVAVSQGGLTVTVKETPEAVQPEPISIGGTTVFTPATDVEVTEKDASFVVLEGGDVSLKDLVDGLNAIGVGAEETISILQAIKASGALHADLEII